MPAPSKRDKQSVKRFEQKRGERTRLRNLSKNFYKAIDSGDEETARTLRDESQRAFARAARARYASGVTPTPTARSRGLSSAPGLASVASLPGGCETWREGRICCACSRRPVSRLPQTLTAAP